jgi:hypothetical protein
LYGCEGVPVKSYIQGNFSHALIPDQSSVQFLDYVEETSRTDYPENDFSLRQLSYIFWNTNEVNNLIPILLKTPNLFKSHFAWHL